MRDEFLAFSPPQVGEEEVEAVADVIRSGWITTGPRARLFEQQFVELVDAPAALAVSSCTDALQVALAAMGVGPGDAVFTTTMTFCATAHVVVHLGATPVFVDVDIETLNLDPERLEESIAGVLARGHLRPRVVIPVHFAGHPCEMSAILGIAVKYGLAVVEDAAHALPAAVDGERLDRRWGRPWQEQQLSHSTRQRI